MNVLITFLFVFSLASNGVFSQGITSFENNPAEPSLSSLEKLMRENPDAYRIKFLELEKKLIQQKDDKNLIELYMLQVSYLDNTDSYDSIISTLHQVRRLLKSQPEKESLYTYIFLSSTFYFKKNYDSLVFWEKQAERLIDQQSPLFGDYLMLKGLRSNYEVSYTDAIKYLLEAATIFEANNKKENLAGAYNNLATIYHSLGDVPTQQEYILKAISINKEMGFLYQLTNNYNNLGISYRQQNRLNEALVTYNLAYEELKKINSPVLLAQNLTNRSNILEKLGDFESAEKLFLECEELCAKNGIAFGVMLSKLNLGNLYRQMKKFSQAKERLEKGLQLSKELKTLKQEALTYERLAWLARDQRDFEQAYTFITKYYSLNDSLINESVKKDANELIAKYEAEKKELEIISLSKDKLYQQYLIALMGLGFLVLVIAVQWWRNKHQIFIAKRLQEEQSLKFKLELKEKELLADSLKRVSVQNTKESVYNDLKELIKDLPSTQASKFSMVLKELGGEKDLAMLQEFETRFLGVYESFFTKLKELAPDLTTTELKIAALIRLNFNSKEMAIITNRSIGTIDNLRSNIRKKLKLNEDINLSDKLFQL